MKWVEDANLIKWDYTRNEDAYRKFFDRLKREKLVVLKDGHFRWSPGKSKLSEESIAECREQFSLDEPVDYRLTDPKPAPIYNRTAVKVVGDQRGILSVEIDTSFKPTQILNRIESILDQYQKHQRSKSKAVRNASRSKSQIRSRAYELIHFDGKTIAEAVEIIEQEFPKVANQKDSFRNISEGLKKYEDQLKNRSFMGFRHFLSSVSNLEDLDFDEEFLKELKRL